jgi:hypothetical protein
MRFALAVLLLPLAGAASPAGMDEIRKEPDPLRRFERSLEFMDASVTSAQGVVRDGGSRTELARLLDDISASAQLSIDSLRGTGKRPSKLSRQYKKGELKFRDASRRLDDLAKALSVEERSPVQKVRDLVETLHEEYLLGVMDK